MSHDTYRAAGTTKLMDLSGQLGSSAKYLKVLYDEFVGIKQKIIVNWSGDTADIDDLIKRLNESLDMLLNLSGLMADFSLACSKFASELSSTSSNSTSG